MTIHRAFLAITACAIGFSSSGCAFLALWSDDEISGDFGSAEGELAEQGRLDGEMETVGRFDGTVYGYEDSLSYITLHAGERADEERFDGWVMVGISTTVEDGFLGMEPGERYSSDNGEVDALGCSGPSHGNWDYDGGAQDIELEVFEGDEPGDRIYEFEAYYPNDQVTRGSFVIPGDAAESYLDDYYGGSRDDARL